MNEVKVTKTNFVIPFNYEGNDYTIWVAQPTPQELRSMAKLLGEIFNALSKEANPMVLMQDWDLMLEEICEGITPSKGEELRRSVEGFFERKILEGNVFNSRGGEVKDILKDADTMHAIKATTLFLSSLLRYASPTLNTEGTKDLTTSLTVMEFKKSLEKSYKESTDTEK